MPLFRITYSRICWTLALVICLLYYGKVSKGDFNFYGDALGYYMYLPVTFIYDNHTTIEKLPADKEINPFIIRYMEQQGEAARTPKGYALNQYTYGVALLELPFFFIAHAGEKLTGGRANGYSESYRNAVEFSSYFYGALGLLITYKLLRRKFTENIAGITTALLLIGTNLFWFMMQQQGMAHVPELFLIALLLHFSFKVHERGWMRDFIWLGLVAGLITVIRPVDGLCLLIPLCYGIERPFLQNRLTFFRKHRTGILITAVCFMLPIIPQLLYWKWLTGSFIYDSYGPNQGFNFLHPHILDGLFGADNGWLCYSPLMIFAVIGLFSKRLRPLFPGAILFLGLYIWAIYSWYVPNYINGLGSRPMVDVYALLAFPFAVSLEWISRRGILIKVAAGAVIILFAAINLNYSIQQVQRILWSEESNHTYNLRMLFRYRLHYDDLVVWDLAINQPDTTRLERVSTTRLDMRDSALSQNVVADSSAAGLQKAYYITADNEYPPLVLNLPFDSLAGKGIRWLRCTGRFKLTEPAYSIYDNTQFIIQVKRGTETIDWHGIRINNKLGLLDGRDTTELNLFSSSENQWGRVSCFIPLPRRIRNGDIIRLEIWNSPKKPIYVSELVLEAFK